MTNEQEIETMKIEYNKALEYFYEAANHMNDMNVPVEKREKWLPKFRGILNGLNKLIQQIEAAEGRDLTEDEIINGFKELTEQAANR